MLVDAEFMQVFGQPCTLAGADVRAIVDAQTDAFGGDVLSDAPSALVLAADAPAAAQGQPFVAADASTYAVRQVIKAPPDGAVLRLVLAET